MCHNDYTNLQCECKRHLTTKYCSHDLSLGQCQIDLMYPKMLRWDSKSCNLMNVFGFE